MTAADRQLIRDRAAGRCEYCRLPDWLPPLEPFHMEHIMARQHGGAFANPLFEAYSRQTGLDTSAQASGEGAHALDVVA